MDKNFFIDGNQVTPEKFIAERIGTIDTISNITPFNIKLIKLLLFEYVGLMEEIETYKKHADIIHLKDSKTLLDYIDYLETHMKKN